MSHFGLLDIFALICALAFLRKYVRIKSELKEVEMTELTNVLLEILQQLAEEKNWRDYGGNYDNGLLSFIPYFQHHLKKQKIEVLAKDIVRALEVLRLRSDTPLKIKEMIEEIFLYMDSRDLKWRTGECDCPRCRGDKKGMAKELEEAIKKAREGDKSGDGSEDDLPLSSEVKA